MRLFSASVLYTYAHDQAIRPSSLDLTFHRGCLDKTIRSPLSSGYLQITFTNSSKQQNIYFFRSEANETQKKGTEKKWKTNKDFFLLSLSLEFLKNRVGSLHHLRDGEGTRERYKAKQCRSPSRVNLSIHRESGAVKANKGYREERASWSVSSLKTGLIFYISRRRLKQ